VSEEHTSAELIELYRKLTGQGKKRRDFWPRNLFKKAGPEPERSFQAHRGYLQPGQIALVHHHATALEDESWLTGPVQKTLVSGRYHAVHVIRPTDFTWTPLEHWTAWDGLPEVIARETLGSPVLKAIDNWPGRTNLK
jgi:hypothetical protein